MKTHFLNSKYIWLLIVIISLSACNDIEDVSRETPVTSLPELTAGTANFSKFVSLGNSLTAGFTDNALFKASQENSFPNILASKFALVGGGEFTQPLMNDNVGGFLFGGMQSSQFAPRLYFNGSGPALLPATSSTEVFAPSIGSKNNMGVPGASSFHLLFNGYGNPANLMLATPTANPYFVRMASSPTATILGDALAQSPTFVSLWIGNNDILGYATSGASTSGPTSEAIFNSSIDAIVGAFQAANVQGVMANIPNVTTIPFFTTVPHNPVPLDAATAQYLNSAAAYGAYNAGIQAAFGYLVSINAISQANANAEIAKRTITFNPGPGNAVVIMDEDLTDLTAINPALISMRQATENDLLVLTSSNFIGTQAVPGNPATVNGVAIPLADKWVLTPEEQEEIIAVTNTFNNKIKAAATAAGFAFVDVNTILNQLASGGISDGNFTLTSNLVTGGAFGLDGVHPTSRGYALIANEFLKAIDKTYGSNFEASGNLVNIGDYPTNYSPALR